MEEILAQLKVEVNAHHDPEGSSVGVLGSTEYWVEIVGEDLMRVTSQGREGGRPGGPRGLVTDFGKRPGQRLQRRCEELDWSGGIVMLTFTWGRVAPKDPYGDLKACFEEFRQHYPDAWWVWRCEAQKRGMPHYHALVGGCGEWVSHAVASRCWKNQGGGWVYVTQTDPERGAWYLAKYVCKGERGGGGAGKAAEAPAQPAAAAEDGAAVSLEKEGIVGDGLRAYGVKRRWGMMGWDKAQWKSRQVRKISRREFHRLRRIAKRAGQVRRWGQRGFTIRRAPRLAAFLLDGEVFEFADRGQMVA